MDRLPEFVMERSFAAPADLVWQAWAEPALFARWYGPGAKTHVLAQDLRPGGIARLQMEWGPRVQYQRFEYLVVEPPRALSFVMVITDAMGTPTAPEQAPDWPRRLLTNVHLTPAGAATDLRLTWVPDAATPAEIAFFASAIQGLGRGWGAGFALLEEVLAELAA